MTGKCLFKDLAETKITRKSPNQTRPDRTLARLCRHHTEITGFFEVSSRVDSRALKYY